MLRLYTLALAVLAADFITKYIALLYLFPAAYICGLAYPVSTAAVEIMPFFNLTPVWNPGVSFGFLGGGNDLTRYLLTGFAIVIGFILPYYTRNWSGAGRLGGRLMAGGAFGNALDRMLYGCVVDFLDFHVGGWHWPAFNVADIAITIGAGLILLTTLFGGRR